jgi:hypothetical protein
MSFERTPRGVVLTDDGEKFLEKAQRVLAAADDALGGRQAIEVGGRLALGLPLDRGLGSAGVALDPAPPKGATYTLQPSTLKSAAPAIAHPSKLRGVVTLTQEQFNYGCFTNTWEKADAEAAYERYAVPETGRIFFQDGPRRLQLELAGRDRLRELGPRAASDHGGRARQHRPAEDGRGPTSRSTRSPMRSPTSSSSPADLTCSWSVTAGRKSPRPSETGSRTSSPGSPRAWRRPSERTVLPLTVAAARPPQSFSGQRGCGTIRM